MQLNILAYWHHYCDNSNNEPQKDFFLFLKFDYGYLNKSIQLLVYIDQVLNEIFKLHNLHSSLSCE